MGVGPFSFSFHIIKYPDPVRRRIEWHLDADHANNFFRENTGYWQVDPAEGGSLVTYAIAVRTTLPGFVTLAAARESLVETIKRLRDARDFLENHIASTGCPAGAIAHGNGPDNKDVVGTNTSKYR